jgi:hypothetical protein
VDRRRGEKSGWSWASGSSAVVHSKALRIGSIQ